VIDPLVTINEYSADALRFTLAVLAVQGRDIKLSKERLELIRNFTNKLFNASKFLLLNEASFKDLKDIEVKTKLGLYIKSRLNLATSEVREHLDSYRFNDAATTLYRFLWNEFCDWGIELAKAQKEAIGELGAIFKEAMKLLHPFMPFISEYLYQELSDTSLETSESIMIKPYPDDVTRNSEIEETFSLIIEAIVGIRRAKATLDIAGLIPKAAIKFGERKFDETFSSFIKLLAKVEDITFTTTKIDNAVRDVCDNLEVFIPLENVDLTPIVQRLNAQKIKIEKEVAKLENMLNNEKFVANAPKEVITQNQSALNDAKAKLSKVNDELDSLAKAAN
jgi:valyl-tRNA synthetase